MKRIILLMIVLMFYGCTEKPSASSSPKTPPDAIPRWNPNNFAITVTPRKYEWTKGEFVELTMQLKNISYSPASFGIMNCSWPGQWTVNSNRLLSDEYACFRNYPETMTLEPGASHTMAWKYAVPVLKTNPEAISFTVSFTGLNGNRSIKCLPITVTVSEN